MGAGQSSHVNSGSEARICYYELLGVDRRATDEEIKKSYRRKALELHPDRNYGNIDIATRQFADIQAAYEVLSDPQERAWYDSHRDAILQGRDNLSEQYHERAVRVTTTADILNAFSHYHGQLDYSDSERGFYTTVRHFFEKLAAEERESCDWKLVEYQELPCFGMALDNYSDVAKPFYNVWSKFYTKKSFSWEDRFRTTDAPDRRVRRMMEKENKKSRDEGIYKYNEAVRSLVAFIKRRDPRYVPISKSEADRQTALRDAAAAQAARSRAANQVNLDAQPQPEWTKLEPVVENVLEESSEDDREVFECVVCSKLFKSEKQWQAHERSKKHLKATWHVDRTMKVKNEAFGLDEENGNPVVKHNADFDATETDPATEIHKMATPGGRDQRTLEVHDIADEYAHVVPPHFHPIGRSGAECLSSDSDDIYTSQKTDKVNPSIQIAGDLSQVSDSDPETTYLQHNFASLVQPSDQVTTSNPQLKMGKAKEKRVKKAARKTGAAPQSTEDQVSPMPLDG